MLAGGALLVAGLVRLGRGLTPLPYPKEGCPLIQTGPFALVRHPMYGGGLVLGFGWALFTRSWLTLGYVGVLFAFLDAKSRREERWLTEKFPTYAEYRRRVRKLVPRFLPRFLGVWLVLNGIAYVIICLTGELLPKYQHTVFLITTPARLGELATMLWLLIRGARPPAREAGARSSPAGQAA